MSNDTLTPRQRALVALSALAAKGDLERLDGSLRQGLDDGLTINEIKEVLVQLYAYAGFPRSLNAIHALMAVLDERREQGIQDEEGAEPSPVPEDLDRDDYGARVCARLAGQDEIPPPAGFQLFAPVIDRFLKEHLFADIFIRDNLDQQSRELATVSALASMTGTEGQLRFHLGAAMNTGLSRAQLDALVAQLRASVGEEEASRAKGVLEAL